MVFKICKERWQSDTIRIMTFNDDSKSPTNDNNLTLVINSVDLDMVSDRINSTLDELAQLGAVDDVLLEAMFKSITQIAYHSDGKPTIDPSNDPVGRHALGRYNQLSRFAGELDCIKTILMQNWADEMSKPQA